MPEQPFGFLNIDKPLNFTSHDVVSKVRRAFGIKKVGHAGTLDPLATGVLIICVGAATRLSEYVMHQTKTYRAQVKLGETTTTDDAEGEATVVGDPSEITRQQVEAILPQFTGHIQQLPPMYSAVKQGGRKLYEIARQGETVERKPRDVEIMSLEIAEWNTPVFTLDVTCGSGTYIRSLARDIGEALGVGAHLAGLVRMQSGAFTLEDAIALDDLTIVGNPAQFLIQPGQALSGYPTVTLDETALDDVVHGRPAIQADAPEDTIAFAYSENGEFIAILKVRRGNWHPHKVFSNV